MAMELFKRERRVSGVMLNCKGRMVRMKGGSGDDGARKKVVKLEFEVPITAAIRNLLDPKIQALIRMDGSEEGAEQEFPMNKFEPSKQVFPAIINMFNRANWSAESKPLWTAGGDDPAQQASICLKSIVTKEDKTVLKMESEVPFTAKIWDWAGDMLGGGECVFKFKPLQGELFKDQEAEEDGASSDEEDVRPQKLKDKEAAAAEK